MQQINVAIDGVAGSGKTTVAVELAHRLHLVYLDTGLMYRAVALACLRQKIDTNREDLLKDLVEQLDLQVEVVTSPHPTCRMILQQQDITDQLHHPDISVLVPKIASCSAVRRELVARQQAFAQRGGVVMVGRDIASVVLPEAQVKIFLEADLTERARRRKLELNRQGQQLTQEQVEAELSQRDLIDSQRADSPLICVAEAYKINTTNRSIEEVVNDVIRWVNSGNF